MSAPVRIQRQRIKGWCMPEGAKYVGRPTRWGNPVGVQVSSVIGQSWTAVRDRPLHRGVRLWVNGRAAVYSSHSSCADAITHSVEKFRTYCTVTERDNPEGFHQWLSPLRGLDLACWCPLDQPCHADVLLELANR